MKSAYELAMERLQKGAPSISLTEDQKKQLQAMRQGPTGLGPVRTAGPGNVPQGGTPLFRAYRYAIDYPGFAGKTLTPGKPLDQLQPKELEKKVAESKK